MTLSFDVTWLPVPCAPLIGSACRFRQHAPGLRHVPVGDAHQRVLLLEFIFAFEQFLRKELVASIAWTTSFVAVKCVVQQFFFASACPAHAALHSEINYSVMTFTRGRQMMAHIMPSGVSHALLSARCQDDVQC